MEGWPVPRVDLGVRPTPVEEFVIDGLPVPVKRDDLCGGNKTRALEFLLAGSPRRVLTYSSLSANHAYATAVHAARVGAACDLVIVRKGARSDRLSELPGLADRVVEVGGAGGALLATLKLWRPGTRLIPPGGASARGALGYAAMVQELAAIPERIYVPLGTGTTTSGLLAGLMLREARCEVVAVRVADRIGGWLLWRRAHAALRLLGRDRPRGDVRLRVIAAEGAYGEPTGASDAARTAASGVELALDATYMAKCLAVLLAERPPDCLLLVTCDRAGVRPGGCAPPPPRGNEAGGAWCAPPAGS